PRDVRAGHVVHREELSTDNHLSIVLDGDVKHHASLGQFQIRQRGGGGLAAKARCRSEAEAERGDEVKCGEPSPQENQLYSHSALPGISVSRTLRMRLKRESLNCLKTNCRLAIKLKNLMLRPEIVER